MALKRGEVNALGICNLRKLDWIPEHFTRLHISSYIDLKYLEQWIEYNLNSRYAFKKTMKVDTNKKLVEILEIGLEDAKELSILTLGCPLLNTRN